MSENNNNKPVKDDEIDLLDLFRRMGRAINRMSRRLGRGVLISAVFLIRNWLPLLVSILLGTGASLYFQKKSVSLFTSDLVLRTNSVTAADVINHLNRLHRYCNESNIEALVHSMSLEKKEVEKLVDIKGYWLIDRGKDGIPDEVDFTNKFDIHDTLDTRVYNRVNIRVTITGPDAVSYLTKGIISFLNSDSLLVHGNRVRLKNNMELIARLKLDIKELDSLQKIKYFKETNNLQPLDGRQMIFLQEQRTQLVYKDMYSLFEKKQALESEVEIYKDIVTVLSDFSVPARRLNGLSFYALRTIPAFTMITILVLIIITKRKKLKEIFNKY
jgi:hypothetical protein